MKQVKKAMVILLCACLMLAASGCKKGAKTVSEGDALTLKMIFTGVGEMKDSAEVWEQFNEKLGDYLPNTTVDFEVIPNSDYAEKWKLISASKEKVDVSWFGWMLNLSDEVNRGSIQSLDDYYQYVPDLVNELPDWLLKLGTLNNKSYVVPIAQMMTNLPYGVCTQKELAEKYHLDTEAISKIFDKEEMITREDFKPFEEYLAALQEAGELRKGVSKSFIATIASKIGGLGQFKENLVANACIDWHSEDLKVYDRLHDFPESMAYYEMIHDWYQKGYIRKDILSLTDAAEDEGKENGYVLWCTSYFKDNTQRMSAKYGIDVVSFPIYQRLYIPYNTPTTNLAVPKTAVSPERSMKLIELLNTKKGKDLYNLLVYGIEGKHYNKVNDTTIQWLEPQAPGTSSENNYGYANWAIGNVFNSYETQFDTPGWNEYLEKDINGHATPSPLTGFTLDTTPIKLELAQYAAIEKEYSYIEFGTNDNFKELLEERNEKYKQAGSDKIIEEIRKQVNAFKESKH